VTEVVFSVAEVVSVSVVEVLTKTTKKREIFLFAKASEVEICTWVRHQYLTSFAGLHFEN